MSLDHERTILDAAVPLRLQGQTLPIRGLGLRDVDVVAVPRRPQGPRDRTERTFPLSRRVRTQAVVRIVARFVVHKEIATDGRLDGRSNGQRHANGDQLDAQSHRLALPR